MSPRTIYFGAALPIEAHFDAAVLTEVRGLHRREDSVYHPHDFLAPSSIGRYYSQSLSLSRTMWEDTPVVAIDGVNLPRLMESSDASWFIKALLEDLDFVGQAIETLRPDELVLGPELPFALDQTLRVFARRRGIKLTAPNVSIRQTPDIRWPASVLRRAGRFVAHRQESVPRFDAEEYFLIQTRRDVGFFGSLLKALGGRFPQLLGEAEFLESAASLSFSKIALEHFMTPRVLAEATRIFARTGFARWRPNMTTLRKVLEEEGAEVFMRTFPWLGKRGLGHLLLSFCAWRELCRNIPKDSTVWTSADFHWQGRLVCELLKGRAETRSIVHGTFGEPYYPVHADVLVAGGELARDWFLAKGLSPARLRSIPSPLLEKYRDFKKSETPAQPRVTLVNGNFSKASAYWLLREFLRLVGRRPDLRPAIRLHPAEKPEEIRGMLACLGYSAESVELIYKEDIKDTLARTDLLVVYFSTAAAEAMLCGIPVGFIDGDFQISGNVFQPLLDMDTLTPERVEHLSEFILDVSRRTRQREFARSFFGGLV